MPHVTFIPLVGVRVREEELLALGMTLPGLGHNSLRGEDSYMGVWRMLDPPEIERRLILIERLPDAQRRELVRQHEDNLRSLHGNSPTHFRERTLKLLLDAGVKVEPEPSADFEPPSALPDEVPPAQE